MALCLARDRSTTSWRTLLAAQCSVGQPSKPNAETTELGVWIGPAAPPSSDCPQMRRRALTASQAPCWALGNQCQEGQGFLPHGALERRETRERWCEKCEQVSVGTAFWAHPCLAKPTFNAVKVSQAWQVFSITTSS